MGNCVIGRSETKPLREEAAVNFDDFSASEDTAKSISILQDKSGAHVYGTKSSQEQPYYLLEKRQAHGPGGQYSYPLSKPHYLLPQEYVLKQQLSDHLPQIFICGAMTARVRFLTWNIMTKCRHTRFPNNGFGKNETGDEYRRRLQAIIFEVANFFAQNDTGLPMIAALQECPLKEEGLGELLRGFRRKIPNIECSVLQTSNSFANVTLWQTSHWRFPQSFRRDNLRALITKLTPVPGIAPGAAPCTFVNVHLEWKAHPKDSAYAEHVAHVAEAVRPCLHEPGLVVVAGDFNMDIVDTYDTLMKLCKGVVVQQLRDSSQVWKDGRPASNTVDGVIWKDSAK